MRTVFIGFDQREEAAAAVCAFSIKKFASKDVDIRILQHRELRAAGLFTRPWLIEEDGKFRDLRDGKPFSSEFSHTRFLVPALAPEEESHVLFVDCDFLFLDDIHKLFALAEDRFAVQCVKVDWKGQEGLKMDGQAQQAYPRKLWSSLVLWNVKHPANKLCSPYLVNYVPGRDLHNFAWLSDEKLIGGLPHTWNWIEGVTDQKVGGRSPQAIHFTEGGPWFGEKYMKHPYAGAWLDVRQEMSEAHLLSKKREK